MPTITAKDGTQIYYKHWAADGLWSSAQGALRRRDHFQPENLFLSSEHL